MLSPKGGGGVGDEYSLIGFESNFAICASDDDCKALRLTVKLDLTRESVTQSTVASIVLRVPLQAVDSGGR